MASKRPSKPSPAPPQPSAAAPSAPRTPRPALAAGIAGAAYLVVCLLILMEEGGAEAVGAFCGEGCGGASFLGVSLAVWGAASMGGLLALLALRRHPLLAGAGAWIAGAGMLHAGASLAFAGSQWMGVASFCLPCQIAALCSFIVAGCLAALCAGPLRGAGPTLFFAGAAGLAATAALWPSFDGASKPDSTPVGPDEIRSQIASVPGMVPPGPQQPGPQPPGVDPPTEDPEADWRADIDPALAESLPTEPLDYFRALSLGRDDAPFVLTMLTDFGCAICGRFEREQLPALLDGAIARGDIRLDFVHSFTAADPREAQFKLIVHTAAVLAGIDPRDSSGLLRGETVLTTPQAASFYDAMGKRALVWDTTVAAETRVGWQRVLSAHGSRDRLLRMRFLNGRTGTPAFILTRGDPASADAASDDTLVLFGFQLAETFADHAREALGGE